MELHNNELKPIPGLKKSSFVMSAQIIMPINSQFD